MDYFRTTWFIVALLVIVAPVGIMAMWLFKVDWNRDTKVALSAVFSMLFVFLCVVSASRTKAKVEENSPTQVVQETNAPTTIFQDYIDSLFPTE